MKIHVAKLDKTFEVKPTNKVIRSVYQFQYDASKLSSITDTTNIEAYVNAIKLIDLIENFLTQTLCLSKAEAKKLDEDFEQDDISEMANYVCGRLLGMSDEDIKGNKPKGTDPKK